MLSEMIVDIGQVLNLPDIDKYTHCCNRTGLEPAPTATLLHVICRQRQPRNRNIFSLAGEK